MRQDRLRTLFLESANEFAQVLIVEKEEAEGPTGSNLSFEEKAYIASSMLLKALPPSKVEILGFLDGTPD